MPSLRVPALMKFYVNDQTEIPLQGSTISAVLTDLVESYPAIRAHIFDKDGNLRRHINLFVNDANIRDLQGQETPLQDNDRIILLPSISGG